MKTRPRELLREYEAKYRRLHRTELLARGKRKYAANPLKHNQLTQAGNRRIKLDMLSKLGGKCTMCGESDTDVLTFDHINNDGHLDRKGGRKRHTAYLVRDNPERFQILCFNCNWKKHLANTRRVWAEKHALYNP